MQQTGIMITVAVLANLGAMVLVFIIRQNTKIVGIGVLIANVTTLIAMGLFGVVGFGAV